MDFFNGAITTIANHFDHIRFMRILRQNSSIKLFASSSNWTKYASTAKRSTFSDKGPVRFCKKTKLYAWLTCHFPSINDPNCLIKTHWHHHYDHSSWWFYCSQLRRNGAGYFVNQSVLNSIEAPGNTPFGTPNDTVSNGIIGFHCNYTGLLKNLNDI